MKIRLLYIGESWLGSCARSMKEALRRNTNVELDEVNEDTFFPKHRSKWLRGIHRMLNQAYREELYRAILNRVALVRPDFVVVYKGFAFNIAFLKQLRSMGLRTINIYPDCSPHAHGQAHRAAVGEYDLVISTKPFHPAIWQSMYGYKNACQFVPQGYDPCLHYMASAPANQPVDIVIVATWRPEYHELMQRLAVLLPRNNMSVAIGGNGWVERRSDFPASWVFGGELHGQSYIDWLRQGKISIAPVTRDVVVEGVRQMGDEDTTRTYELAAAHCFFIHRRTNFVQTLYDDATEVPMYETPEELAEKIEHFLAHPAERCGMSKRAHQRAVPNYALDRRADEIVNMLHRQADGVPFSAPWSS